jgi:hypothetical protein
VLEPHGGVVLDNDIYLMEHLLKGGVGLCDADGNADETSDCDTSDLRKVSISEVVLEVVQISVRGSNCL